MSGIAEWGSSNWRPFTATWHVVDLDYWTLREDITSAISDSDVRKAWLDICCCTRVSIGGVIFQPLDAEMLWIQPADPHTGRAEQRLTYVTTAWRYAGHWCRDPAGWVGR